MEERENHKLSELQYCSIPVTRTSVSKSLEEIVKDPATVLKRTHRLIQRDNPGIDQLIQIWGLSERNVYGNPQDLAEGIIFGYKFIRESAIEKGINMPILRSEALSAHFKNGRDEFSEQPNNSIDQFVLDRFEDIRDTDPDFVEGIEELCKYKADPITFYKGAVEVYKAINKVVKDEILEREIFGNTSL
jgi:hypothetical protein